MKTNESEEAENPFELLTRKIPENAAFTQLRNLHDSTCGVRDCGCIV